MTRADNVLAAMGEWEALTGSWPTEVSFRPDVWGEIVDEVDGLTPVPSVHLRRPDLYDLGGLHLYGVKVGTSLPPSGLVLYELR